MPTRLRDTLVPGAAAAASASILGASFVAIRYVIAETEPATLGFLRFAIAIACIAPFAIAARNALPTPRHLVALLVLGGVQFGLFHFLINGALDRIPASRGAVIFSLIPILTMLIAVVMRYEAPTWSRLLAAMLSVVGIALALGEKAFATGLHAGDWTGELMFFGAVCCGAGYNALSAPYLQRYSASQVTVWAMLGGLAALAAPAHLEGAFTALPTFSVTGWASLLFLAVPGAALSLLMFNFALRRLSPTGAAIFIPLAPIVATALGALLLDERISLTFAAGLACIVASIVLANRR